MIFANDITNFERPQDDLEEFWIFSICVAGKSADQTAHKVHNFLESARAATGLTSPMECIGGLIRQGMLDSMLQQHRMGQYRRIGRALRETWDKHSLYRTRRQDFLRHAPLEEIEAINGVGPKTTRFFLLHSRPRQRLAALDTHILKFLRDQGVDAPKTTPSGKKYLDLEQKFLMIAENTGKSVADLDLEIWKFYSQHPDSAFIIP